MTNKNKTTKRTRGDASVGRVVAEPLTSPPIWPHTSCMTLNKSPLPPGPQSPPLWNKGVEWMNSKVPSSIRLQWRSCWSRENSGIILGLQANVLLRSFLSTKDKCKHLGTLIYLSQGNSVDIVLEFENEAYHMVKYKWHAPKASGNLCAKIIVVCCPHPQFQSRSALH